MKNLLKIELSFKMYIKIETLRNFLYAIQVLCCKKRYNKTKDYLTHLSLVIYLIITHITFQKDLRQLAPQIHSFQNNSKEINQVKNLQSSNPLATHLKIK